MSQAGFTTPTLGSDFIALGALAAAAVLCLCAALLFVSLYNSKVNELRVKEQQLRSLTAECQAARESLQNHKMRWHNTRRGAWLRKRVAAKKDLKGLFNRADTNGDGKLTRTELENFIDGNPFFAQKLVEAASFVRKQTPDAKPGRIIKDYFTAMDADANGEIDVVEFLRAVDLELAVVELFEQIDTDGSGDISKAELSNYLANVDHQFEVMLTEAGINSFQVFEAIDTDANNSISLEEFLQIAFRCKSNAKFQQRTSIADLSSRDVDRAELRVSAVCNEAQKFVKDTQPTSGLKAPEVKARYRGGVNRSLTSDEI